MRFTLALNDYYEQGAKNLLENKFICPVCYEEVLDGDLDHDAIHIKRCYMLQRIEIELEKYIKEHGEFPKSVRNDIISKITNQFKPERVDYIFLS
ncbi:hypothetical protein CL622_05725 [archaeon]|nr:hypothetical protein [archaeon]|tara:strand:+ start:105 stop:389 length:285 start_codon:yes stop_codon:yes gene_type:complete